jgi:hypothetical protein
MLTLHEQLFLARRPFALCGGDPNLLGLGVQPLLNEPPDSLGPRGKVGLDAPPFVNLREESFRGSHLKGAIVLERHAVHDPLYYTY